MQNEVILKTLTLFGYWDFLLGLRSLCVKFSACKREAGYLSTKGVTK